MKELDDGVKNVFQETLAPLENIVLPRLHIKLGLMKQLAKALIKEEECLRYIFTTFPSLSDKKSNCGIFDGPQI